MYILYPTNRFTKAEFDEILAKDDMPDELVPWTRYWEFPTEAACVC